ncbi:MAG: hypothetical protein HY049_08470 [Acidobacteria bacterium]|nr:hypothetical protein [Acidobacteriota bacterium]
MRRSRLGAAVVLAAIAIAGVSISGASTFLKVDVPTLQKMSESVVHAKVVDIQSAWNDEGSAIFTLVTLDVKGRLHGTAADQLIVRVPGGTVGDFTSEMEGAPKFHKGDEVVAFIARWYDGVAMVAGYAEGLSKVKHDQLGNLLLEGGLADGMPMSDLARQLGRAGK